MATTYDLGAVAPVPKGEYVSSMAYEKLNIVSYDGGTYIALQDTQGNVPTNTVYWQLLAKNGTPGAKGERGDVGPAGATGTQGLKGDTGARGPQGLKGDQGIQGPKGATGDRGPAGPKGDTGARGPAGSNATAGKAYVTATWRSGDNWYRKYSDGFIIQGGKVSFNLYEGAKKVITFPLKYSSFVNVQISRERHQYGDGWEIGFLQGTVNTSQFTLKQDYWAGAGEGNTIYIYWISTGF